MKKLFQSCLNFKLENKFSNFKEKITGAINKHPEAFCLGLLGLFCLVFLFLGLNLYQLIDVDETRYAVIARNMVISYDWNSLILNGAPFLEKPPLYFWFVAASIKLFGHFTPFIVRLPIALSASFLVFFTYFLGKKVISRKFGVISALVLLTSALFLILAHVAILDMIVTVMIASSIYCAFITNFCEDRYKKYGWWYFYLFMALGVLAKGLIAVALPAVIVFAYALASKTLKDMFKPINILPGIVFFLLSVLPWHLLMYQIYGFKFINDYFLVHHFGRFAGSEYIGRVRPWYFFIPVFLLGFLPWSFIFLASLWNGYKTLESKIQNAEIGFKAKIASIFESETNEQKLLLMANISFFVIFLLFSSSSTKLPTYILPAFPFAALLTGYYWWYSDEKQENEKVIYNLTLLFSAVLIIAALVATFTWEFLPYTIFSQIDKFCDPTIKALYLLGLFLILRLSTKKVLPIMSGYFLTMFFVIVLAVFQIFNVVYKGGENEIVRYSTMSKLSGEDSQLVTFDFAVKPSALMVSRSVAFVTEPDFKTLDKLLKYKSGDTYVIVKNKNFIDNPEEKKGVEKRLYLLDSGNRYSLYVHYKDGRKPKIESFTFFGFRGMPNFPPMMHKGK